MVYLLNAFALSMVQAPCTINITEMAAVDVAAIPDLVSAVGHAATAATLTIRLGRPVATNRATIALHSGDCAIVAQLALPRLAEGQVLSAAEMAAAPLRFLRVEVLG